MRGIAFTIAAAWVGGDARVVGLITAKQQRGFPGAEEQIALWDSATGQRLLTVASPTASNRLAVSPDGKTFVEAGEDKMVRLRDTETLAIKHQFRAHDAAITALAWHPTRPILATGSEDLTVKLWNLDTLKLIEEFHGPEAAVRALAFSPTGGRLACLAMNSRAFVWEPASLIR